jgi:arsenite methyltransferase
MADLTDPAGSMASDCCAAEAQTSCCAPSHKADCCTPEATTCSCSAGSAASTEKDIREVVREK